MSIVGKIRQSWEHYVATCHGVQSSRQADIDAIHAAQADIERMVDDLEHRTGEHPAVHLPVVGNHHKGRSP